MAGMQWVGQEELHACGVACLAMLLDSTYQVVRADMRAALTRTGLTLMQCDSYLQDRGFAVARKHSTVPHTKTKSVSWPPAPFADRHLCLVRVKGAKKRWHYVVLQSDGVVLDPSTPEPQALSDYAYVYNVAGLVPIT